MAPKLGKESEAVSCLNCRAEVRTTVKRELSQSGWIWSFVLCCFAGLICTCVPCCMDAFYDYTHQCPNCNAIIGKSTPDDREEEKKNGMRIVIALLVLGITVCILFGVLRVMFGQ